MTEENQNTGRVLDEENRIEKRVKDRILDARDRVAEREDDIFVGAPLDRDVTLSQGQLVGIWSTTVRQYLKTIEPLLRSDEIEDSRRYYLEIPIYEDVLYPPDGETIVLTTDRGKDDVQKTTRDIQWSLLYNDDVSMRDIATKNSLFSSSFEPPEPKPVKLHGLKSIIEQTRLTAAWETTLNPGSNPTEKTHIAKPQISQPLNKATLEHAVRKADQFLADAGVGLEIGDPTKTAKGDYSDVIDTSQAFKENHD